MMELWADVGGTFTDCLIVDGNDRRATKVLSSGITKGRAIEVQREHSTRWWVRDPQRTRDPRGFWVGFQLRWLDPQGRPVATSKVIQSDPAEGRLTLESSAPYEPNEGQAYELTSDLEAPVLAARWLLGRPLGTPLPPLSARLGTTRGTNALLTRQGARVALLTTQGFQDCLRIGEQARPDLFTLTIRKFAPLTEDVWEIDERLTAEGDVLRPLDLAAAEASLRAAQQRGVEALAICLLHAYRNPEHERRLRDLAERMGFTAIRCSHEVAPLIKLVARAETTVLDGYLHPLLERYVQRVGTQLGVESTSPGVDSATTLTWMTSGGSLVESERFRGVDSVLSGPAGGVVGLATIARQHRLTPGAIGLDMGGTSTDVSLFDGQLRRHYESRKAGLRMLTPMMAIETVASGGGSICRAVLGQPRVGPQSAGAEPGPACYGRGGPLTVTDLNLLLGRIDADRFPFRLDAEAALRKLRLLHAEVSNTGDEPLDLAEGCWRLAIEQMAEAVRTTTTAEGVDPRSMTLVGFGGAAGQHLTAVADALEIDRVLDHPDAALLSAVGIGHAEEGLTLVRGVYRELQSVAPEELQRWQRELEAEAAGKLATTTRRLAGGLRSQRQVWTAEVRYAGTEATIELPLQQPLAVAEAFGVAHQRRFGYQRPGAAVELVAVRLKWTFQRPESPPVAALSRTRTPPAEGETAIYWRGRWQPARQWLRDSLRPGDAIEGPARIVAVHSTLLIDPGWRAVVQSDGALVAERVARRTSTVAGALRERRDEDPVLVALVGRRLQGIADAMGEVLRRTAISVNVKERLDFSCAIFRGDGTLVANAPHVPVHLGAMGHCVRHLQKTFSTMHPSDCFVTNDPYAGGSHLPDVTVVRPVFTVGASRPDFFVAARAHHAEIGGKTPGSMPPAANCLAEEGVVIRDFALVREGDEFVEAFEHLLASGPFPSRNVAENLADVAAQRAAVHQGVEALVQLSEKMGGAAVLDRCMEQLQSLSARAARQWIGALQPRHHFVDRLDDGTPLEVDLRRDEATGRLRIDFTGTAPVHPNGFNATPGIVTAAILYVMRCALPAGLPLNEGVMREVDLCLPSGLLNPPAGSDAATSPAVVAGNVETSQRIVDVLLGALGAVAASQGTMNNVLIGDASFGYYETIGGGAGATAEGPGADAVHTHMTNTRMTDPEVLETRYPIRLWQFAIRPGSGGRGRHRGGNGIVREWEFLRPLTLSWLTGRRTTAPYGAAGGEPGKSGENGFIQAGRRATRLAFSGSREVQSGDRLRLETPGGGGWGTPSDARSGSTTPE